MNYIYENVEWITNLYGTVNCFNPFPAFYDCLKSKNYNAIPPNYYIMTSAMNFTWVIYGMKVSNDVLVSVSTKYTLLYAFFALVSIYFRKEFSKIIYLIAFIGIEYYVLSMLDIKNLGIACTIVQLISDSSQWESIIKGFKSKDSSFINIKQQLISIVSSMLWTILGYKQNDHFLTFPNGYNSFLHLLQIIVAVTYNSKKPKNVKQD